MINKTNVPISKLSFKRIAKRPKPICEKALIWLISDYPFLIKALNRGTSDPSVEKFSHFPFSSL